MIALRFAVVLVVLPILASPAIAGVPDARALDAAVKQAMTFWHVPGVAIVRDDKIIYLAGHGFRSADKKDPVTPDTLFPLGSCSKAFTTAAIAGLVDEKKLDFDDRVSKHLSWFHLSDPLADREVRLRDLLCHRTGVASHNALWYRAPWKPEETVRRIGKLPLTKPFRTAFQYQSTMFTAAGLAAAAAAGQSWPELIRKRLLEPLNMKDTHMDTTSARATTNFASGFRLDNAGEPQIMPRCVMAADAAGSIHSTARDMAPWLRFHLSDGMAEGKRLVSARALGQTHTPQMVMRLPPEERMLFPGTLQFSYAMAWVVYDHGGLRLLAHGGAIDGFRTQIILVPDKKLGLVVLSNLHQTPMNLALAHDLLDRLLELPRRNYHPLYRKSLDLMIAAGGEQEHQRQKRRQRNTKPSHELAAYAGLYEHPAYGQVTIEQQGGSLILRWREDKAALSHFHYDTFTAQDEIIGHAYITFSLDRAGDVDRFDVTGNLGVEFRKVKAETSKERR